jgi:predicted Fe-S protein YdhL (DUF1289 family)
VKAVPTVSTPCVNVCVLDPLSALCIGCGRTAAEIAAWATMNETDRVAVMADLPQRLTEARSRSARGGRVASRRRN